MWGCVRFTKTLRPRFMCRPQNICKCFACGEGGTSVHFVMKHEQLSYADALRFLAKKYNIEVEERELTDEQKQAYNERESLFILNEYARDYFANTLHNHLDGKTIGLSYFRERGFRDDIVKKFQLGYSLEGRDAFTQTALKGGYKKEFLVKTGLTIEGDNNYLADRFRGRVMFPVHTLSGKVIAFGGRILKKAENTGKYVNSPESEIYHKSNELYGIYFAKQTITKNDCCYLVEGYTDVLSMHQAGIENVVASSGTALTHGQIRLIHRFTKNVTVIYDGDAAGIKAALRGIDLLLGEGMNIKVVLLPDGEDPDSFAKKQNADSLNKYIKEHEVDFIRFKTKLLIDEAGNDPIKRAALITDIVNSISVIPDNIIRSIYIKDCSRLLDVDERILVQEVGKRFLDNSEKTLTRRGQAPQEVKEQNSTADAANKEKAGLLKVKKSPLDKFELSVLYYVVRFGSDILIDEEGEDGDHTRMTVLQYAKFDLERDSLWLKQPIYKQMLDEAVERMDDESFSPKRYFLAHPDAAISRVAANILGDRYQISKVHIKQYGEGVKEEDTPLAEKNNLDKSVPRALTELKNEYVRQQVKEIKDELSQKYKDGDYDSAIALMQRLKDLEEVKKTLAKVLGERIVLRY